MSAAGWTFHLLCTSPEHEPQYRTVDGQSRDDVVETLLRWWVEGWEMVVEGVSQGGRRWDVVVPFTPLQDVEVERILRRLDVGSDDPTMPSFTSYTTRLVSDLMAGFYRFAPSLIDPPPHDHARWR
jgi:hypothetical protein